MLKAFDLDAPSLAHELFPEFMGRKPLQNVRSAEAYKPTGHSAAEIRDWLLKSIESEKVTATEWARISGLAPSTLNRFINNVDSSANLSARTIDNLAIGMRRIIGNRDRERPVERDYYQIARRLMLTVDVPIIGAVSAYNEKQSRHGEYFRGRNFLVPVMYDISTQPIAAFATMDSFMGVYPSGTVILSTPVHGWKHFPIKGARYVHHEKVGTDHVRATIYNLKQDPQGSYWFMPVGEQSSRNPGIYLGSHFRDEKVQVPGKATFLVVGSLMPDFGLQRHYDQMHEAAYHERQEAERAQEAEEEAEESGRDDE